MLFTFGEEKSTAYFKQKLRQNTRSQLRTLGKLTAPISD
jgi:hypothetical protein